MKPLPLPLRVAAGLAVTAAEQARELPKHVVGLPVTVMSQVLQFSMRLQQQVTELAIKGDEALSSLRPAEETPSWATFDEDLPPAANGTHARNGFRAISGFQDPEEDARDPWEQEERALAEDHTEGEFDSTIGDSDLTTGPDNQPADQARPDRGSAGLGAADPAGPGGTDTEATRTGSADATGLGSASATRTSSGDAGDSGADPSESGSAGMGSREVRSAGVTDAVRRGAPGAAGTVGAGTAGAASIGRAGTEPMGPGGAVTSRDPEAGSAEREARAAETATTGLVAPGSSRGEESKTPTASAASTAEAGTAGADAGTAGAGAETTGADAKTAGPDAETAGSGAVGAGPIGIANYDELTLPQLRARLRRFGLGELEELLAYERAHENRPSFVGMLTRRIGNVRRLADGGPGVGGQTGD